MNRLSRPLDRSLRLGAVVAFATLSMVVPASLAQTPESAAGGMDGPHPAHIHVGTCADIGDVVVPLSDVTPPEGDPVGATAAVPVKTSLTLADMHIEDMVASPHAINVHKSAEEMDVYIACGDIGGVFVTDAEDDDTELRIGLTEQNNSGHSGVVWLGTEGDNGDQTEVVITLIEPEDMS